MNEKDRARDWVAFYKASPPGYQLNALIAVLRNDGPSVLKLVLKDLGLGQSVDLVTDASKKT